VATVVLMHGIAQEQLGAATLEQDWLPALADGLRAGGHPQVAARIWPPQQPGGITARMAYYGNLFLTPGTMGTGEDAADTTDAQRKIADRLATEWLSRAAERDNPDQQAAAVQLSYLDPTGHQEQGLRREAQRSAINGLTRLRWFAPFGMAFAGKFVNRALQQVTRYLSDHDIRAQVQGRVAAEIDDGTQVLIGHSLGSVIAYEAAHQLTRPLPLLITLGSPLGCRPPRWVRMLASLWVRLTGMANAPSRGWGRGIWWSG